MMTVRFPSGFSVQYNTAAYVMRQANGYTDLYTKKDGTWVAQVPTAACIVEAVPACRVYTAQEDPASLVTAFERAVGDVEQRERLSEAALARIKRLLSNFDARASRWK